MGNSFEDAKSQVDGTVDDKKHHSTVPSMIGSDEKKHWSDSKEKYPEKSYPPPDVEIPQNDPPPQVFASYPPRSSRRWGLFVPAWLIALFLLIFLFESSVLFVYTIVGLYKETAPVVLSAVSAAGMPSGCNCGSFGTEAGANSAPKMVVPSVSIVTVTDASPATQAAEPPMRATSIETSVSTESSVSTTTASGTTTTASASTTTATPPASTTITTITPTASPAISTTFSTSTIPDTNKPAPEHTIFSTQTVPPSSSGKRPSSESARKAAVTTTGASTSASTSASLQARCTWPFCCSSGGASAKLHPGDPC